MSGETERLFFALWPDSELRELMVHETRKAVRHSGGRPVRADNFHITLIFIGAIAKAQRGCLEAAAALVEAEPFVLQLDRLGYWSRPKAFWLGCEVTPTPLTQLVRQLGQHCAACGYQPEQRPFTPHLTLARKVQQAPHSQQIKPMIWAIDHFCLIRSQTLSEGVEYEVVAQWSLGLGPR